MSQVRRPLTPLLQAVCRLINPTYNLARPELAVRSAPILPKYLGIRGYDLNRDTDTIYDTIYLPTKISTGREGPFL